MKSIIKEMDYLEYVYDEKTKEWNAVCNPIFKLK